MKSWFLLTATCAAFIPATAAQAEIIFGPRVSYYFDNSNLRTSDLMGSDQPILDPVLETAFEQATGLDATFAGEENIASLGDQISFPMIGGTVSAGDDKDRFTLTAMFGSGSGRQTQTLVTTNRLMLGSEAITDFQVIEADANLDLDRYDFELTWQRRLNEKFAIFGGVRYERLEIESPTTVTADITFNIPNRLLDAIGSSDQRQGAFNSVDRFLINTTVETFSARLGATAFVPLDQSITAFFNGMIHASHQPKYTVTQSGTNTPNVQPFTFEAGSETSIGPDFAVGMQVGIAPNVAMDIRYRAIIFFPVVGSLSFDDVRVNHGVNLGVSFRL
ncbi:MAG: hypothetical protein Pars2KO_00780 [Parasphingorhabdus sp.]